MELTSISFFIIACLSLRRCIPARQYSVEFLPRLWSWSRNVVRAGRCDWYQHSSFAVNTAFNQTGSGKVDQTVPPTEEFHGPSKSFIQDVEIVSASEGSSMAFRVFTRSPKSSSFDCITHLKLLLSAF